MRENKLVESIENAESLQEAIAILNNNGVSLEEQELKALLERENSGSELTENELESISGGAIYPALKKLIDKLQKTSAIRQKQGSSGAWHSSSSGRHG